MVITVLVSCTKSEIINKIMNFGHLPEVRNRISSFSKADLTMLLHLEHCIQTNMFYGNFNWYSYSIAQLENLMRHYGIPTVPNAPRTFLLYKLFERSEELEAVWTEEEKFYKKLSFLSQYGHFIGNRSLYEHTLNEMVENRIQNENVTEEENIVSVEDVDIVMNDGDDNIDESKAENAVKDLTCVVCYTNKKAVLYMKCGHIATCISCSKRLKKQCPICRTEGNTMKVYF